MDFTWPMKIQIWSYLGEGSTQVRWRPPVGSSGKGLNSGMMMAIPMALTLKPQLSLFRYVSGTFRAVVPPQETRVIACEYVHDSVKGLSEFPAALCLICMVSIFPEFIARFFGNCSSWY